MNRTKNPLPKFSERGIKANTAASRPERRGGWAKTTSSLANQLHRGPNAWPSSPSNWLARPRSWPSSAELAVNERPLIDTITHRCGSSCPSLQPSIPRILMALRRGWGGEFAFCVSPAIHNAACVSQDIRLDPNRPRCNMGASARHPSFSHGFVHGFVQCAICAFEPRAWRKPPDDDRMGID